MVGQYLHNGAKHGRQAGGGVSDMVYVQYQVKFSLLKGQLFH
jgi:hypothetical protein